MDQGEFNFKFEEYFKIMETGGLYKVISRHIEYGLQGLPYHPYCDANNEPSVCSIKFFSLDEALVIYLGCIKYVYNPYTYCKVYCPTSPVKILWINLRYHRLEEM